jgi:upstream activation factor subunit UAF30
MPKGSGLTKPLQLSPELADLVGAKKGETLSRPEVVKRIWAYLKTNKLQDPENKQYFTPDAKMVPIFGKDKVRAFGMAKFLKTHLTNTA